MNKLMNKTIAMSAIALALTGCDADTLPDKNGNSFGEIQIAGETIVGQTLSATVTDANGVDESAISYMWEVDDVALANATSSSIALEQSFTGANISVTASYVDNDGYAELIKYTSNSEILLNLAGTVTITGTPALGKLLTATLVDDNGFDAESVVYTWFADGVVIGSATGTTFALTANEIGKVITVTATYTDNEGFVEEGIPAAATPPVAATSENEAAIFSGLSASISNSVSDALTGTISITDADAGEDSAKAQTSVATMYGTFSIAANGDWTYKLNLANSEVAALGGSSDRVTDTISISSVDGTMVDLVITITGTDPFSPNKVAKITDGMIDDAGELRYKFGESFGKGKLTVRFFKGYDVIGEEAGKDPIAKDSYIALYGNSTSSKDALVDLRIHEDTYEIREKEVTSLDGEDPAIRFKPNQWNEVEMTWDTSAASTDVAPLITVTINGESITNEAFSSSSTSLGDVLEGVRVVVFKLGDTKSTIPDKAYYIDDVKVFSDLAGTTVIFEDDFESYEDGYNLDPGASETSTSVYNTATAEAFVTLLTEPLAPVDAGSRATFTGLTATTTTAVTGDLTGTVVVSDDDGADESLAAVQTDVATTYGTFSIADTGAWTYTLDTNNADIMALVSVSDSVTDTIAITSVDGTQAELKITISGVGAAANIPAMFAGSDSKTTTNDNGTDLTGIITVTDDNAGEDSIVAQSAVATLYGTFSIDVDGNWTYMLDTANATVTALPSAADSVDDVITIESFDGTMTDITITITGVGGIAPNKIAKIVDSSNGIVDPAVKDTGELYYPFAAPLNEGQVSMSILYGENELETAYISIYTDGGSTKTLIGELQLNEGEFSLRSNAGGNAALGAPNFTPGTWIDVVLTWNTTSTTEQGTYSVTIDDVVYGPFKSENATFGIPATATTVRLASNDKLSTDAIYVDNYAVYSDEAGTMALLEEDFEGFDVDETLEDSNTNSPFGSRTFDAVAIWEPGTEPVEEPPETADQIAQITDSMTGDAGELRYKLDSAIVKGKMTVSFLKEGPAIGIEDGKDPAAKDAYIAIYGESTSSSAAIVDLRIQDDNFAIRDQDDIDVTIPFTPGVWTDVEITWDASLANDIDTAPLVTVTINGVSVTVAAFASASSALDKVMTGARYAMFKLGDNSSTIADAGFYVNDVVLSDTSGDPEVVIFEDDFEGYMVGDSLDTDNDSSPYHSNTAEAVVAVKE